MFNKVSLSLVSLVDKVSVLSFLYGAVLWIRAVFRADRESRIPDPKALK